MCQEHEPVENAQFSLSSRMADFSFLSDSSDEIAIEELLNQAMDHSVLEQVAAINCSGFTSDSVLPTHLETRFRKLKSFPAPSVKSLNSQLGKSVEVNPESHSLSDDENEKNGLDPKLGSKLSNSSSGDATFSPSKENRDAKLGLKSKSRSGSFLSPSDSPNFSMESPSPPKKSGCFWCSPKLVSWKNSKENRGIGRGFDRGRNGDDFLSDLSIFSGKEQEKILKKAMKEEEKINREAEKIVKWAKQASARMNISDIVDELSDSENPK